MGLKQHAPLPEPAEKAAAVDAMFDTIAPRYDRLNRILTLGLDAGWRRTAVRALGLRADARVLDIACGTGDFCRELEATGAFAIGLDRSAGMLAAAAGTRAPLVRGDGLHLPVSDASVDGITCGFALRNVVALEPLFAECARVLKPGGRFAFLEVAEPESAIVRAGHRVYFRHVVPFIGGLLSDRAAYRYLPDSTAYLPSPDELTRQLTAAGFIAVTRKLLGLGAAQLLEWDRVMTPNPVTAREPGLVVATTRRVTGPVELLDWLGPDGFAWFADGDAFVTAGTVASVDPHDAVAFLQSIEHEGDPGGRGIRAVGALPFEGAGQMTVPARIVERDTAGTVWATTVAPVTREAPEASAPRGRIARRFSVEACQGLDEWDAMVTAALALIETHDLEKVVLAREVVIEADVPFEPATIIDRLRATQPDCFVYAAGGFVGATPELLVRRTGADVVSRPMAGTVPRAASPEADRRSIERLVSSVKESREHRLVVDAVAGELARWCEGVVVGEPEPMRLTSVTHLTTRISGRVRRGDSSAVDLALALHPTPAVNGAPRDAAFDAIARLERFDRASYAGPVGWVDARGDGEFAVALRGATLDGNRARLLAGAGIVAGSDPDAEWAETQAKLEPMLRALVRP